MNTSKLPSPRMLLATVSLLTLGAVPLSASASTLIVPSTVRAATVFPSGASIRRVGTAHLSAGDHELRFGPLPQGITDDSVRVGGMGPGLITEGLTVRVGPLLELSAQELSQMQEQLGSMQYTLRSLMQRRAQLAAQRSNELSAIDQQITTTSRTLRERTAALAERQRLATVSVKYVAVDLQATRDGDAEISVEYLMPGAATWRPTYAAYLTQGAHEVSMDVLAALQQNTGEDWSRVRLTLSSVNPTGMLAVTRLQEQALSLAPLPERDESEVEEMVLRRRRMSRAPSMAGGAGMAMPDMMSMGVARPQARSMAAEAPSMAPPPPPPSPMEQRAAVVRQNMLSARLEVSTLVNLRSGAAPRRVLAARVALPCTIEHLAAPRESSTVFLSARARNAAAFALLAGPVSLFVDNEYVGSTALADVPVQEEVSLPFGVDPSVSVDRTLASRAQTRNGGRDEQALHYDFRVSNHRQEAVDLVVIDRLPVSHSQGLLVQRTAESRAPLAHQEGDAPGVVRWNVRLAPGASDRWHHGVRVSMPHGRALETELES